MCLEMVSVSVTQACDETVDAWAEFSESGALFESRVLRSELRALGVYPLDTELEMQDASEAIRITLLGEWGSFSYLIMLQESQWRIRRFRSVIHEFEDGVVRPLLDRALTSVNREEVSSVSDAVDNFIKSLVGQSKVTERDLELGFEIPYALIERYSERSYKGLIVYPAGYSERKARIESVLKEVSEILR